MKKTKIIFSVFLLVFLILPIAVNAKVVNKQGGKWDYSRNTVVWSKYYHKTRTHSSTLRDNTSGISKTIKVSKKME